jgi:hypothetical protein
MGFLFVSCTMIFERGYFRSSRIQKGFINESKIQSRNFSSSAEFSLRPTVFLSHKHDDLEDEQELLGFIDILENSGAKIYIDSLDNTMPNETSGDTANRIKEIIKYCNKFILLATKKAIESQWCNWELGIGDTHKFIKHIALLPIKEKDEYDFQYRGNEYLQIYPRIDYRDGTTSYRDNGGTISKGYYICKPPDAQGVTYITPLKDWLKE